MVQEIKYTDEQTKAIEAPIGNTIISAGAGSGKTKVLTERVLGHVLQGIDVDELLILTFTNAAANEMKTRIRTSLIKSDCLDNDIKKKQLNKIDSSFIMTFDAYSLFIVKKYHLLLNLDSDIQIADSNIIRFKVEELLDEILEEKYKSNDVVFFELINTYCVKDDANIRKFIIELNNQLDLNLDRDCYIKEYENNFFSDEILNKNIDEYTNILIYKLKAVDDMLNELANYVDLNELYDNYLGIKNLKTYEEIKLFIDNYNFKNKKFAKDEISDKVKKIRTDLRKKINGLREDVTFDKQELIKQILDTKDYVLCILSITNELNRRLNIYKKENNLYEFNDIAKMAIKVIKDNDEIRNEIRDHFKEILIDEYQDTSDIQELFISLISNNNVYVVGDIKQSIYRFRNANPDIFKDKYERYSRGEGYKVDLTNNFRSREQVLSDINIFFNRLMSGNVGGADYKNGHSLNAGNLTYKDVQAENYHMDILSYDEKNELVSKYGKDVVEAFIVAKDILNKKDTYRLKDGVAKYSDFTILVDRSSKFDTFKKVLTYFNIPVYIETEEKMSQSDLISVIKNVFKLLVDDTDKHAYVSLERSFVCEFDDEYIYKHIDNFYDTETFAKIKNIKYKIENKTISMILDDAIKEFNIYENLSSIKDVNSNSVKLDYLYTLANDLSNLGYTYKDFNNYLANVFDENDDIKYRINNGKNDAVILTNFHKSKGLEYNIVYYPCLNYEFNTKDKEGTFLFSKRNGLIFSSMINNRGLKDTISKKIYAYNFDLDDIGEKIRLFYVALTRAKEKIILINSFDESKVIDRTINDEDKLSICKYSDMLSMIKNDLNPYIHNVDLQDLNLNNDYKTNNKSIYIDNGSVINVKHIQEYVPVRNEKSHFSKSVGLLDKDMHSKLEFGTKMHYYLETLDFVNPDFSDIENRYVYKLKSFLNSNLMKDINKAKVYKEYEFIYNDEAEEKHGIIDLLLEYDDHFVIVDYKTKNIDDEHYDEQLNGYRNYIRQLSNKDVKCYLYSIIDETYREINFLSGNLQS